MALSAPNLMACMGKVAGCMVCIAYRSTVNGGGLGCGVSCTSIGATCSIAAGRVVAQYNVSFFSLHLASKDTIVYTLITIGHKFNRYRSEIIKGTHAVPSKRSPGSAIGF